MDLISFLVVPVALYVVVSLRVLKQYERGVVFLLGKFEGVRGPGLTLIFIPIQQMVRVSLRTVTMQIPSQKIITKDNVSIDIAAVAYYHISDPEKAVTLSSGPAAAPTDPKGLRRPAHQAGRLSRWRSFIFAPRPISFEIFALALLRFR